MVSGAVAAGAFGRRGAMERIGIDPSDTALDCGIQTIERR
jgi:methylase of polypeptide subunit release factors